MILHLIFVHLVSTVCTSHMNVACLFCTSYHELTFTETGYFVRIPYLLGVSVFPHMILCVLMPGVPGTLCSIAKFSVRILKWGFTEYNFKNVSPKPKKKDQIQSLDISGDSMSLPHTLPCCLDRDRQDVLVVSLNDILSE